MLGTPVDNFFFVTEVVPFELAIVNESSSASFSCSQLALMDPNTRLPPMYLEKYICVDLCRMLW
jgi:hypothetical protein